MKLTREEFHALAEREFAALPEAVKSLLVNVEIAVQALPGREAGDWKGARDLLGLYTGLTREEMLQTDPGPHLPARVMLYQRNLERGCRSEAELAASVRDTLRHELGHHLGMTDAQLKKLGC